MSQPTLTAWTERHAPLLTWARAVGAALVTIIACATAWQLLQARVAAAEVQLSAHGAQLRKHDAEIRSLQQGHRDLAWNIYVVCTLQAQQLGITADSCRRPPER